MPTIQTFIPFFINLQPLILDYELFP